MVIARPGTVLCSGRHFSPDPADSTELDRRDRRLDRVTLGMMIRLVALVTLTPSADAREHVRLLREMAASEENVLTAEVGICEPPMPDVEAPASYVYTATFADRASLERYATGRAHHDLATKMDHEVESTIAAVMDTDLGC